MASTNLIAGIASLTINGAYFDVIGDLSYSVSFYKQEALIGQSGLQGYGIMPIMGYISFKCRDNSSLTIAQFSNMLHATLQVKSISGKMIVGTDMACVECSASNTQTGEFDMRWESVDIIEITT